MDIDMKMLAAATVDSKWQSFQGVGNEIGFS
jgi:hypothetical protein